MNGWKTAKRWQQKHRVQQQWLQGRAARMRCDHKVHSVIRAHASPKQHAARFASVNITKEETHSTGYVLRQTVAFVRVVSSEFGLVNPLRSVSTSVLALCCEGIGVDVARQWDMRANTEKMLQGKGQGEEDICDVRVTGVVIATADAAAAMVATAKRVSPRRAGVDMGRGKRLAAHLCLLLLRLEVGQHLLELLAVHSQESLLLPWANEVGRLL